MSKPTNALVVDKKNALSTMETFLTTNQHALERVVPEFMTPQRLIRLAIAGTSRQPRLLECTPQSILLALMDAAYYGLEPNPVLGHAFLIPYRNNKRGGRYEAQFQTGYKGLVVLAHRAKAVRDIQPEIVHEHDKFRILKHEDPPFYHEPAFIADPGKPIGAYAVAVMADGHKKFLALTLAEIERYRARSRATDESGPWFTDWEAMAKKTAVRRICATLPLEAVSPLATALSSEREFEESGAAVYAPKTLQEAHTAHLLEEDPEPKRDEELAERLKGKQTKQATPQEQPPPSGG